MKTILDFYVFRIRKKRADEFYPLDNIEDTNFTDLFTRYNNWLELNPLDDQTHQKILAYERATEVNVEDDGESFFQYTLLNIGNYGYRSDINDKETGDNLFEQQVDHASMYPLFIGVHYQSGMETGIIALQQEGNYAMKTQFLKSFSNFLNENEMNLMLKMSSYLPEEVIMEMIGGATLKKIKFVKYHADRDEARNLGFTPQEIKAELQYTIKDPDETRMRVFLNQFIRNIRQNRANFLEIENFEYDSYCIVGNVNGADKTFYPGDLESIRGTIDISNDIDYNEENRAVFNSIRASARIHLKDFGAELMQ